MEMQKTPGSWRSRIHGRKELLLKICLALFAAGYVLSYCSGIGESLAFQYISFLLLLLGCLIAIL